MKKPRNVKIETLEDFKFYCNVSEGGGCWEWTLSKSCTDRNVPYGALTVDGKVQPVHRLTYQLANPEEDISEKVVRHECDNPLCCNPKHLLSGSQKDNIADRVSRNRSNYAKGERVGSAKLSEHQIDEIRYRYIYTDITQSQLGKEYGVGQDQISRIVNHKRWVWKETQYDKQMELELE